MIYGQWFLCTKYKLTGKSNLKIKNDATEKESTIKK